ncbi:MAG: bifunctional diguanylate cyclase/phosphodiesterase [Pseudomonadota bacterium]
MKHWLKGLGYTLKASARIAFVGPQLLAFVPALTLGGYWFGGEMLLVFLAVLLPAILGLVTWFVPETLRMPGPKPAQEPDLVGREALVRALDDVLTGQPDATLRTAAFAIELDGLDEIRREHGAAFADHALAITGERLKSHTRRGDIVARSKAGTFLMALSPLGRPDLEAAMQVSRRIQRSLAAQISLGNTELSMTASIGFCQLSDGDTMAGADYIQCAEAALRDAQASGTNAVRAYTNWGKRRKNRRSTMADEVANALEAGQIQPWFQPQINTDTGAISGMEALARWQHPERGMILPGVFLPTLSAAGLTRRLGECILSASLQSLKAWEEHALNIPNVSVNFSHEELADPTLQDRITWELDRHGLEPDRLVIEILETVVSDSDSDIVARNINQLHALGCAIDLDDFGTGHASIASIRRFSVGRIKIDRSFVARLDADPEQQSLFTAILEMAERLGVETLAEGVETVGEHALLAQLGCRYVQGYLFARPMPFEDTLDWIADHNAQIASTPRIAREAS